jgi:hypothetical protein
METLYKQKASLVMLAVLILIASNAAATAAARPGMSINTWRTDALDQSAWIEKRDLLIAIDAGRAKAKPFETRTVQLRASVRTILADPPPPLAALCRPMKTPCHTGSVLAAAIKPGAKPEKPG